MKNFENLSMNEQINIQFQKVREILNNTKEFKNNYELITLNTDGCIFANKDYDSHFLLPRKNKKSLTSFDVEKIECIKTF